MSRRRGSHRSPPSISLTFLAVWALLHAAPASAKTAASRPKLVVVVAVDQMRADYVEQYGAKWRHGLRRLFDGGAWFRRAAYPYVGTVTCAGHATIATGTYPATHGMILNAWWDRAAARVVSCTEDAGARLVSYGGQPGKSVGDSAQSLRVPNLPDEMRVQLTPPPRVASFSMKPRSAVMLAGHHADAVVWFEGGSWVTSTAFARAPVDWVARIVAEHPIEPQLATTWDRLLDAKDYLFADDAPEEKPIAGWKRTFPHPLRAPPPPVSPVAPAAKGAPVPAVVSAKDAGGGRPTPASPPPLTQLWEASPAADGALADFARGALGALGLGKGPGTDYLAVSFSTLDRVGHAFGPRSHEIQDVLARLDVVLGEFMADLDRQVGKDGYVLAFTSDHGVAIYPEQLKAEGKDAGRVNLDEVKRRATEALRRALGPGEHIASHQYTDLYLAPGVLDRLRAMPDAMNALLGAIREVPGVDRVFATDELRDARAASDPLKRAAVLSHFPGRSGDVVLLPKPYWMTVPSGTTHGTHNEYDQRVPIVLYGSGVKPGKYDRPVSPADLAPTLAAMLGVRMPSAEGQPLREALAPGRSARRPSRSVAGKVLAR